MRRLLGAGCAAVLACSLVVGVDVVAAATSPGDARDCADFGSWNAAQVWFETYQPEHGDVARLDSNGDGVACESLAGAPTAAPRSSSGGGYWMLAANGTVFGFGDAGPLTPLVRDSATAVAAAPDGGYWVLGGSGAVHARGAAHHGNATLPAGHRATAIAGTGDGAGYWVFTDRGAVVAVGAARHHGDMQGQQLNGRIIAAAATPTGLGYWLVGSDGGIFTFGDAVFRGSTGAMRLNQPVVGIAPDPDGDGYWLVAADGGIFAFRAPFRGSAPGVLGGRPLNRPIVGALAYGNGYLMVASDGGIFSFSDRAFHGSLGATPPREPIVSVAVRPTTTPAESSGPDPASRYVAMTSDVTVAARTVLLSTTIELPEPGWVFVQTDGSYEPIGSGAAASVHIEIDGAVVSNRAEIDWRGSTMPVAHSFNAIGADELDAGEHTIELVAEAPAGSFDVAEGSNLSAVVDPADSVETSAVTSRQGPFDFTTEGDRGADLDHRPVATLSVSGNEPVVALAAGSLTQSGHAGDAMLALYRDGAHPGNLRSLWPVQDLWEGAELTGPLATHALLPGGPAEISLDAVEFPWDPGEDPAIFAVLPSARLVTLTGHGVVGYATASGTGNPDQAGSTWDYACVGSSIEWPGCPESGDTYVHAESTVVVPPGHSGIVLFATKARVAGDEADEGGVIELWLTVDGVRRGSTGRQELRSPSSVSTRTLSASYLAAGDLALTPGTHTVRVMGRATGSFRHVSFTRDIPLLWFG